MSLENQVETKTQEISLTYDTHHWLHVPITFDYFYNKKLLGAEKISILFPHQPVLITNLGLQFYSVIDQDGLEYSLAAMQVPSSDFDLRNSVNFLLDSLKNSYTKTLVSVEIPETKDSPYHLVWIEKNKITRLTLIRSSYFIYFLETSHTNDDLIQEASEIKTAAFVNSFDVLEGFSLD